MRPPFRLSTKKDDGIVDAEILGRLSVSPAGGVPLPHFHSTKDRFQPHLLLDLWLGLFRFGLAMRTSLAARCANLLSTA